MSPIPPLARCYHRHKARSSQSDMAADLQSLDGPDSASATAAFTGAIDVAATMTPASAANAASALAPAMPTSENGPPQKRQRRPSVRLGEIGDQATTLSYELQGRRPKASWRLPREKDPSKPHKARSLTHLVNGNNADDLSFDFRHPKTKPKRGAEIGMGTVTKRARSNLALYRNDEIAENNPGEREFEEEDEEQGQLEADDEIYQHRDFEPVSGSPVKDLSPFQSGGDATATDSRERKVGSEGVRSWLIELGLSRYVPFFEIHEVDEEVVPMLTLEDLKDMGINAVGSRRKLFSAIQKLNRGFSGVE